MFYEDVFKELNRADVRYLIVGGLAVNLHGFSRTTLDLDLAIALSPENKTKFYNIMRKLKFKTKNPALAKKLFFGNHQKDNIRVVTFYRDEFELIDVFIQAPFNFEEAYAGKQLFKYGEINLPVIAYSLLLEMKEQSGRERDLIDIGYLKLLKKKKQPHGKKD